jgi:selenoprotein W-related protein
LTAKLLPKFKGAIRSYKLIPSKGGCFELTVGGELLYSKRATGEFPNEIKLIEAVAKKLGR